MKKEEKERIERIARKNEEFCWETYERDAGARGVIMESRDMKQVLPRKLNDILSHSIELGLSLKSIEKNRHEHI